MWLLGQIDWLEVLKGLYLIHTFQKKRINVALCMGLKNDWNRSISQIFAMFFDYTAQKWLPCPINEIEHLNMYSKAVSPHSTKVQFSIAVVYNTHANIRISDIVVYQERPKKNWNNSECDRKIDTKYIKLRDKVSISKIRQKLKHNENPRHIVRRLKWGWAGHESRMAEER